MEENHKESTLNVWKSEIKMCDIAFLKNVFSTNRHIH